MSEPAATARQGGLRRLSGRTFPRLLGGLLVASLPITIVLAVVLTQTAGNALS